VGVRHERSRTACRSPTEPAEPRQDLGDPRVDRAGHRDDGAREFVVRRVVGTRDCGSKRLRAPSAPANSAAPTTRRTTTKSRPGVQRQMAVASTPRSTRWLHCPGGFTSGRRHRASRPTALRDGLRVEAVGCERPVATVVRPGQIVTPSSSATEVSTTSDGSEAPSVGRGVCCMVCDPGLGEDDERHRRLSTCSPSDRSRQAIRR